MLFKPFPILTLVAIPALALLIGLGVWQLQRAEWKAELINEFREQTAAEPVSLEQALCDGRGDLATITGESVFKLVFDAVRRPNAPFIRMFGANDAGEAGWRLMVPIPAPECGRGTAPTILVEMGFEPFRSDAAPSSPELPAPPNGELRVSTAGEFRFVRAPWPAKPMFAAENNPAINEWHWFDASAIATAVRISAIEERFYLKAFSGELPASMARTPPGTHIGYAVTWFGMAIAFVVIYALFHARAGRLRFRKQA